MARIELSNIGGGGGGSTTLALTTTGTSGASVLTTVSGGYSLNIPVYQGALSLSTAGTSGASTLVGNTLTIPTYQGQISLTTTGTSGAATLVGNTLNVPQYSTAPGGSTGEIQYNNAGAFGASANLAWVNSPNPQLNIGAPSGPTGRLNVKGGGATSSTVNLRLTDSGNTELFKVLDNGSTNIGTGLYWDNPNKRLSIDWSTPLAPFVLRGTRATQVFYSSGLTTPIPFTSTTGIGPSANGEYVGAINQTFQATGGLVLQGFTSAATSQGFTFQGHVGSTAPTAPALIFQGFKFDGTDGRTAMTGTEGIANFQAGTTAGVGIVMGIKANATVNIGGDFTPSATVHVRGSNTSSGVGTFLVQDGAATPATIYRIDNDGKVTYRATNTAAGTTGAQTINRPSGTVNFAAGATALVVTNSLCATASLVFAEVRTNDATAQIKNVVPAAGSFTINLSAAATAETSVGFFIIN